MAVIGSFTPTGSAATYPITPASPIAVGAGQVMNIFIIPNNLTASTTTARIENNTSVTITASTSSAPEINITGAGNVIADGDATPSATDDTSFGSVDVSSGTISKTFTINNTGSADLTLGAISFSGTNAADFTVTSAPTSPVAQGTSTTFTVTFDPSAAGARTATISIVNNDSDENPYDFALTGTGTTSTPALAITGATTHGTVCPNTAATGIQYTITNTGATAAEGVTVVSSDPQFVVSSLSSTTIAANGGTVTYTVTFTPTSAGAKSATITVSSTTTGSNTATSSLTGTGATPVTAAVTTSAATAVAATTATLNGNVTALGTCPASTTKGFVYSQTLVNNAPTFGGTGVTTTSVAVGATGTFSAAITGLTQGTGYSFRAYVYDGTNYTYGNVLTFTTTSPPANDDCANAIALTLDAAAVSGNTANATQSVAGCTGNANDDVWYSFTTASAGTYIITVTSSASFDAVVGVRSGACPGTSIFCIDQSGSGITETVTATGLAAATTYYVRVYDFAAGTPSTTTFTIAVSSPPATLSTNGTTTLSFASTNVGSTTASQTFNLSGANLTGAPGTITVSVPNNNFEVSNNNTTWGATTTIAYSSATLASTPVYVRFSPQSSGAKTGNLTFSGGGVSGAPTIALSGTGTLAAPVATAATNVTATSFTANWNTVPGATAYLLDVSTSPTFGTSAPATVTESFETGLTGSYQTGNVTLATGVWAVTNVLKGNTGVNSGTGSAQLQSATGSALVSPTFNSISSVSFWVTSSTSGGAVQLNYSTDGGTTWTPAPGSPFTGIGTTKVQRTAALNLTGDVKIQILRTAATMSIDDIVINYTGVVPSYVTGYQSLNVGNVTNYNVTGLASGATHYYRVRATDGTATSANSGTISVTPASVGGTVAANQTLCSGSTPADLTLTGNVGSVVRWERSSDIAFTSPVTIANTSTTLSGATIGALTATTYFRAVVQNGSTPAATSSIVTITVDQPSVGGTISGSATVCGASNSGTLTLSGYTGSIVKWQSATTSDFSGTITDYAITTNEYNYANLSETTYYRVVVMNGVCASAFSNVATVTVIENLWTGAVDTNWNTAGNWACNTVPTFASEITIPSTTNQPIISNDVTITSLTLEAGTSLTVQTGYDLTLNGVLTVDPTANMTIENNANLLQISELPNSGPVTVERNSSALMRQDYTLWSSPVSGQNLLDFSPLTVVSPTSRFYTYNVLSNLYTSVTDPANTNFADAAGYLIRMPNNHPTTPTVWGGEFTGVPHNGDYTYTMVDGGAGMRFNLVGNPYPSPIDMFEFVDQNETNITGTLYFWRKTNGAATPAYVTWTEGTYTENGDPSQTYFDDQIQTGQGFFVEGTGAGTTVSFDNLMRVGYNGGQFFKATEEKSRIWLNATSAAGEFSQTALVYVEGADSNAVDKFDGRYINDGSIALTSMINDVDYTIQGRAPFVTSDVVPLRFMATAAGDYSIAIDHVDGLFSGSQDIFLKDMVTGITHDLKAAPYNFNTAAGTFASRFEVLYDSALGNNNPIFNENSVVVFAQNGNISIKTGAIVMDNVKVFDIRGRLVAERTNVDASELSIATPAANQVLIVKITSQNNEVVTKKVVN
jgi:hypothetical protein